MSSNEQAQKKQKRYRDCTPPVVSDEKSWSLPVVILAIDENGAVEIFAKTKGEISASETILLEKISASMSANTDFQMAVIAIEIIEAAAAGRRHSDAEDGANLRVPYETGFGSSFKLAEVTGWRTITDTSYVSLMRGKTRPLVLFHQSWF